MILASVTIYECDKCKKTFAVKSDEDWNVLASTWHVGIIHDFCSECKTTPQFRAQMREDFDRLLLIADELENPAGLQI